MKCWQTVSFSVLVLVLGGCSTAEMVGQGGDDDGDTGSGTGETDTESFTHVDTGSDTTTNTDTDSLQFFNPVAWISNVGDGTLSKIDTQAAVEVARYETSGEANTIESVSVNLHGDVAAVGYLHETDNYMVVKVAGTIEACVSTDGDPAIKTSTGPADVLPWGEDECVLWSTPLEPVLPQATVAQHGIAWDGTSDPGTGAGGHVWFSTCRYIHDTPELLLKLDGDNGDILDSYDLPAGFNCARSAAVDNQGRLWLTNGGLKLLEVDMETLAMTEHAIECGSKITLDSQGLVWAAGVDTCVHRYDPDIGIGVTGELGSFGFISSVSIGRELSADYVWITSTSGWVLQVDPDLLTVVDSYQIPTETTTQGAYPDLDGFLWGTHFTGHEAYRFDPTTEELVEVDVGPSPRAFSDCTGAQLHNVVIE